MKITFFGAVQEVTGSRYLVETEDATILVDCGLFQGLKELTRHNWDQFPVDPTTIDALVLTHAHIDHTGYIPLLVKNGFRGKIYCSPATSALSKLLLLDSGSLQENEAERSNKRHPDRPPVKPLYTKDDAQRALDYLSPTDYGTVINLGKHMSITLIRSGHILGSSFVVITDGTQKLTFSGDLGRPQSFILKSPPYIQETDFLVLESTYGDRLHEKGDPLQALAQAINDTVKKGGMLLIPSFAVERTQELLYCLHQLKKNNTIPNLPIFLDSPLAIGVTNLFCDFNDEHTLSAPLCKDIMATARYITTPEESKQLDLMTEPAIIIAGSGMADGGRIIYHLKRFITDAKNTVLFVGFQAPGTLGRALIEHAQTVTIHGEQFNVKAAIASITMLSAHADADEILAWLTGFKHAPKKVFLTHGEKESAFALQKKIEERFGWLVVVPKYGDSFELE